MIDITSDSQVNSNFPYRWSPASLKVVTTMSLTASGLDKKGYGA